MQTQLGALISRMKGIRFQDNVSETVESSLSASLLMECGFDGRTASASVFKSFTRDDFVAF